MSIPLVPIRHAPPLVTLATRGLAAEGHPELHLTVREDRVPPQLVHWLASALAAPVLHGERWADGEIVPFGWATLRFTADGDALAVEAREPSTGAWVRDATPLLVVVGRSNELLERLDLLEHGRYPHAEHTAAWPASGAAVRGIRHEPAGSASGWVFEADPPAPLVGPGVRAGSSAGRAPEGGGDPTEPGRGGLEPAGPPGPADHALRSVRGRESPDAASGRGPGPSEAGVESGDRPTGAGPTEPVALWRVAEAAPSLLPALALPPGSAVELVHGRLVRVVDPFGRATDL